MPIPESMQCLKWRIQYVLTWGSAHYKHRDGRGGPLWWRPPDMEHQNRSYLVEQVDSGMRALLRAEDAMAAMTDLQAALAPGAWYV